MHQCCDFNGDQQEVVLLSMSPLMRSHEQVPPGAYPPYDNERRRDAAEAAEDEEAVKPHLLPIAGHPTTVSLTHSLTQSTSLG